MNKTMRKGLLVSVLSLSLVTSLTSVSLAAGSTGGMDMGSQSSTTNTAALSTPHEATPGMDSNMPGMENNSQSKEGHEENGESEGVNWPVVGSFLGVDLMIIAVAGIKKYAKKSKLEILG